MCRAGSAVGVGLLCSAYPAGVKAEGKRGGKWSGSRPAATPRCGLLGALLEPRLPARGGVFGNPAADANWRLWVPATFPYFPAPGKQRGCLGCPRRSRKISPSLEPALRGSPAPHAACIALCVWVWVGGSVLWVCVGVLGCCVRACFLFEGIWKCCLRCPQDPLAKQRG